ncbi:uncharacterized protein P884DRAFT_219111 [Thermothelomyces heterothallicus CBS 202.75]|uniref:uncharacterized protein n=1 Tax=Thermothelomyces heterothallicus CBS 202.75 TaxID=1149848 RepID=UPI0037428CF0
MPPRRGRWSLPSAKASQGRLAAPRGKLPGFVPATPNASSQSNGFSMRDEAKHTASHQAFSAWASEDAKLRQKPVTFVSAGYIEPLKERLLSEDPPGLSMPGRSSVGVIDDVEGSGQLQDATNPDDAEDIAAGPIEETAVDIVGQISLSTEFATKSAGSLDQPSISEGGETKELFFFDLAENEPTIDPSITPPKIASPRSSSAESDSSEEIILFKGRTANSQRPLLGNENFPRATPVPPEEHNQHNSEVILSRFEKGNAQNTRPPSQGSQKRSKARRRRLQALKAMKDAEEDAILADYVANMVANSDDDLLANQIQPLTCHRDLGDDDDAIDFGVTEEKSPKGDNPLDEVEEEFAESDASDTGVVDFVESDDDHDTDADTKDEALARLFSEQEELGVGSDDLLLLTSAFANTGTRKSKEKRVLKANSGRAPREPPSATQVADAFDCLDLADWGYLSGRTRKRRSKQPPNFNVSDSEIEAALKTAWQRDRERKKSRKQERETLRSQGLLGKEAGPDDLRVKYLSGMRLDDIKLELTSFLVGSAERLEFPPLDKHARKVLHELASKFDIKSQSTGKGDQRRPVLYRTNRTVRYASTRFEDAARHVDQMASRIHRKYFHRVDVKVQKTGSTRNTGGSRSGHKALTFREGEIVGASVPELGRENKGRAMLEKMGWSKGMALGASDNQGILEPVAQIMKRSKAGLG